MFSFPFNDSSCLRQDHRLRRCPNQRLWESCCFGGCAPNPFRAGRPSTPQQPAAARASRNGWSLVEVLITTAILATLTGLTMPAISTVTGAARHSACQSNLRQVSLAFLAYAGDYCDQLPAERNHGVTNIDASPAWFARLPPYTERRDVGTQASIFQCPAHRYRASGAFSAATPKSFKMNDYIDAAAGRPHYRLGLWADEQQIVLMADGIAKETGQGQWGHLLPSGIDARRHRGRVNWLALDGHTLSTTQDTRRGGWVHALRWYPAISGR